MNPTTTRLDGFESALLTELKSTVARTAVTQPAAPRPARGTTPHSRQWLRRPRWYVAAALAVVAAVLATVAVNQFKPTPAFAVSGGNNTDVTVRVMRLEGAAALEKALKKKGINADISYLPPGSKCAGHRHPSKRTPGLELDVSSDDFIVHIPAGSVGPHDIFVMAASLSQRHNGFQVIVDFGISNGPVKPCRVVPAR